ncbi:GNAT family N-acetyltransferase [Janthinobacterium sp. 1_2014MBL_MicDiv]|uniref:GNAT family N-acetyltransferase n=1 Tax=Janthinobacterium sp. 1_2014MBL_MicDiv TaxID=1644131 RepID=UPI0008F51F4F|nr:GNAT family N-acetyltransferase [Janthinobacterium sp. 1_2014MBL_MicDiv]APA70990.1 GCN5 family acetyltransferase [Janthinobacterium sp. 1_2014MBL_MicDiv]
MQEIMELVTPRLLLRQWRDSDLAPFAALNADPRVMEYFPSTLSREASDAMARRCGDLIAGRGWGLWAVALRETDRFIGMTGLHIPDAQLPCSPCVEIGWRLAFDYWGQGYAQEAAQAALRAAYERLQLPEIVSFTALPNRRSSALMARLGMRREAATFEHPALPPGHALRTHCLYRLTRAEWCAREGVTT